METVSNVKNLDLEDAKRTGGAHEGWDGKRLVAKHSARSRYSKLIPSNERKRPTYISSGSRLLLWKEV